MCYKDGYNFCGFIVGPFSRSLGENRKRVFSFWRGKMSEVNQVTPSKATSWRKRMTAMVTCPSGEEVEIRRTSIYALVMTGRIPEALSGAVLDLAGSKSDGLTPDKVSPDTLQSLPKVIDALLVASVISPQVVLDGADEEKDEINVRDVPDSDRMFLFSEIIANSPNLPVEMKGGEASMSSLTSFRPDGQLPGDSTHSGEVQTETE
jgi:hypothetical protein